MQEFYQTRMGHAFYEHTMPTIAKELERLNAVLERIAAALEKAVQPKEIANEDR